MRIALISDIHGNDVALRAVLDDIAQIGVDQIVCLGDVATLGPAPGAVIRTLRDLGCPCVMGNHDAFLLDTALIHTYTEIPVIIDAVDWCRSQLAAPDLAFLQTFQPTLEITLDAYSTLLLFHGSPRSHMENVLATTAPADLDQMLAGYSATIMAGGHTHIQMLRQHRGMLIVNTGSIGMPFREFARGQPPTLLHHGEYAIVEAGGGAVGVNLRRVPLNKAALRAAAGACAHPLREMLLQEYA